MDRKTILAGNISIGPGAPPVFICGPCVIEDENLVMHTAEDIQKICSGLGVPVIFKCSYTKANRQSGSSYSGPGLEKGLAVLRRVREKFNLPILTDIHEPAEASPVAEVADIIQIPAFLCRQTELVRAAAKTGKAVNIKKGQFLAPEDMADIIKKAVDEDNENIMVTERGTTFGYHNLVVDFRSIIIMKRSGYPVIFDATHSVQLPGAGKSGSGGQREFIAPLARAAAAAGADGYFIETHPEPEKARCDAKTMLPLDQLKGLISSIRRIHEAVR